MQGGGKHTPWTQLQQPDQNRHGNGGSLVDQQQIRIAAGLLQLIGTGKAQPCNLLGSQCIHALKSRACGSPGRRGQYDSLALLQQLRCSDTQRSTLAPATVGSQYQCSPGLSRQRQYPLYRFRLIRTHAGRPSRLGYKDLRQLRPVNPVLPPAQMQPAVFKQITQMAQKMAFEAGRVIGFDTQGSIFGIGKLGPVCSGRSQQQQCPPSLDRTAELSKSIGIETRISVHNGKVERTAQHTGQLGLSQYCDGGNIGIGWTAQPNSFSGAEIGQG